MSDREPLYREIRNSFKALPINLKKKSRWVLVSLFFNSIFDLLGIAAIFPLFSVLIQDDFLNDSNPVSDLYNLIGFTDASDFVVFLAISIFVMVLLKNLIYLLSKRFQAKFAYELFQYYTTGLLDTTFARGHAYITQTNSNDLLRDLSHVPRMFGMSMVIPVLSVINELVVLLIIVGVLTYIYAWVVLILLLALMPVIALFYRTIKKRIQHLEEELNDLTPKNTKSIFDVLFGYQDIKVSGTFDYFRRTYRRNVGHEKRLRTNITMVNEMPVKVVEIGVFLAILIVLLYSYFWINNISDRVMLFGIFGLAAFRVMPSLNKLVTAMVQIKGKQYTLEVISRLNKDAETEVVEKARPVQWKDKLELKNLGFAYDSNQVLNNINLTVDKGAFVGIIGPSGSGKTTLVNILLRFLEESTGELLVDGKDISKIGASNWMASIAYVKQDVFILDGSVSENVAFGVSNPDPNRIADALSKAELSEFVEGLEKGIDTRIGEKGALISGGQKQRIGIARALYRDPQLLILDESTSSLDPKTEQSFLKTVNALVHSSDITVIFITHRHNSLSFCSEVYEMNNGNLKLKREP